jgi:hypothetical protein
MADNPAAGGGGASSQESTVPESSQESTVPESSQESEPKDEVLTFKGLLGRELKMTVQQWQDTPHYMGAYGFKMTAIGSKGSQFTHFVPASALADVPVPISYLDTKAASPDAWVTMDCAAQNNDVAGVTAMLGHEGFMEGVKTMGINQALISAAQEGHVDIVRLLLPRADNSAVRLGSSNHPFGGINSALVHASSANSAAIVELLLPVADQRGANLALMFAINEHVHQDIVRILLPRADLRGINEALRQAVGNGHLPIVEMLVAHGAEVTMNGNEMVFLAYGSNPPATYEPILNFLVAHGADLEDGIMTWRPNSDEEEEEEEEEEEDGGLSAALAASMGQLGGHAAPPCGVPECAERAVDKVEEMWFCADHLPHAIMPERILEAPASVAKDALFFKAMGLPLMTFSRNSPSKKKQMAKIAAIAVCILCGDGPVDVAEIATRSMAQIIKANNFFLTTCSHIYHRKCLLGWVKMNNKDTCPDCRHDLTVPYSAAASSAAVGGGGAAAAAAAAAAGTCCSGGDVRAMCFTHRPHQPSPADISRILACPHTPWAAAWWLENDDADICDRALRGDFTCLDTVLGGHLTPALKEAIKCTFSEENFGTMVHHCHTCGAEGCEENGWRQAEHGEVVNMWFCESCFPKCFTCQSEEVVEHPEADKWYCEAHKTREDPPGSGCFHAGH